MKIQILKGLMSMTLAILFINAASANSITHLTKADPSGTWEYEVSMPDGSSLSGDMKIAKVENEYEVTIYSNVYGTMELENIVFEENTLEATVDMEGDTIEFEFEIDGDSMEGKVYTPEGELEMTAKKKS